MLQDFFSKNSRSILIIGVLIGIWLLAYLFSKDDTENYLNHPQKGQIYIFQEDELYAPMRLDSVSSTQLYMRNYLYLFSDAIPDRDQILTVEFDLNFYAIYKKEEVQRLYKEGSLVKIYP